MSKNGQGSCSQSRRNRRAVIGIPRGIHGMLAKCNAHLWPRLAARARASTRPNLIQKFARRRVVGIVAGWLAGQIVRGGVLELVGDLVVGVVAAFVGNWLMPRPHIHLGVVALIVNATVGA